ncbi:hypothetical protein [Gimesia maris]|uniref:hypothetical protein n=1 Tax=Gimesia maris TaxID=122 RepID=UPI0032EDDE9E
MDENFNLTGELDAMRSIGEALSPLDSNSRERVLRWAFDIYNVTHPKISSDQKKHGQDEENTDLANNQEFEDHFESAAELLAAASPSSDVERVLVVGYWFQEIQGLPDLDSQSINTELKHQGHGVKNITSAFGGLISQRPQLVIQLKKSGNSKQARKKYKLTTAGIKRVKSMLLGKTDTE